VKDAHVSACATKGVRYRCSVRKSLTGPKVTVWSPSLYEKDAMFFMSTTNEPLNPPSAIYDVRVSKFLIASRPSGFRLTIVRIAMAAAARLDRNSCGVRTLHDLRHLLLGFWE